MGQARAAWAETMLVLIREIILIEKTGQFVMDDFSKNLDDVRCEGNWPIVGWARLASSFVNRGYGEI